MQLKAIVAVLATAASMVAADATDSTTTQTSTQTRTITITQCNPTVTNCPAQYKTNSTTYPLTNSTVSASPTPYLNTTTWVLPTSVVPTTTPVTTSKPSPTTVSANSAGGLYVQSGLLLGVIGAGIALLA